MKSSQHTQAGSIVLLIVAVVGVAFGAGSLLGHGAVRVNDSFATGAVVLGLFLIVYGLHEMQRKRRHEPTQAIEGRDRSRPAAGRQR
ncbi:hypothetical protein [Paraburkholderia oxyphila]|uniref:hypothetical protein n=1 Tax=Paraburkholderia oxyphila TaxID=614212 RepID=UPI0012EDD300|nr:hypothetical protein [Paraburkholderia oxyphila]